MMTRRHVLGSAGGLGFAAGMSSFLPAWAKAGVPGVNGGANGGLSRERATVFDLNIDQFPVRIGGRTGRAVGINGQLPGPLIRFREGDDITLRVHNRLREDTSIHWHGLLVPFFMDGVPGVTFPGIAPGTSFEYRFSVPQSGTYWYHSHSGLQEPLGHYGPLIIDPKGHDHLAGDREYVLVLSDWSFENPHRIFAKLKKMDEVYNVSERTMTDFLHDARSGGLGAAMRKSAMWGAMRMSPRDLADVTGATYTYLINGHASSDNWTALFRPGERLRLRIINASSMSLFNVRIPGLPMTVVQADGLSVAPVEIDEMQIGVAETYDVLVTPKSAEAFAFVAESIDRSGQVVATLAPRPGMRAAIPDMRPVPSLTMKDMGHAEHAGHANSMAMAASMDDTHAGHAAAMTAGEMTGMTDMGKMRHDATKASVRTGPGVANIAMAPVSRLNEAGIGLNDVPHRVLRYADLRALAPNPDTRQPGREMEIHLTGNMERYMWSFDGVKFSEVTQPIIFHQGERIRVHLINDTMMPHPIHLHGMFFDVVIPGSDAAGAQGHYKPRKHTIVVKPGEKLAIDISADHIGDWAFHCHLIHHMHAGMMQVVSVLPGADNVHAAHRAAPVMQHESGHSSHSMTGMEQ